MPERRKTAKTKTTTQTSLKDLFRGTNPKENARALQAENAGAETLQTATPRVLSQPSRSSKSTQLYPIFTKVSSMQEDIGEVPSRIIDITDASTDTESSTEPHIHLPSPRSGFSDAAPYSTPASPDVPCDGFHSDTRERTRPNNINIANKRVPGSADVVPLPSSYSQHVRGPQRFYTASQTLCKRKELSSFCSSDRETLDFLAKPQHADDVLLSSLSPVYRSLVPQEYECLQSTSRDYAEHHPAFTRTSTEGSLSCGAEMWTRRFRPRRANEVLGNEQHALYLRDWLNALELRSQGRQPDESAFQRTRGIKRPRVIRAVNRKRGNKKRRIDSDDDPDEFVVFSDPDKQPTDVSPEDSEDEFTFCQRTLDRLHGNIGIDTGSQSGQTDFSDSLTNTLLITGPPGCGKTAAVYACAEELGWEVFEVYPGIGRRNGASLDHLVGDVGRNHIVQTVHNRAAVGATRSEARGLEGYLGKGKKRVSRSTGTERRPIDVDDGNPTAHEVQSLPVDEPTTNEDMNEGRGGSKGAVGQSLVLLEEVDVLFKEDAGFWPAVVDLIRSCQRPVVMTCNDVGLVPVGDLPLQKVLVFEPCPSSVAATFLQCLSVTEGWHVPHEDLVVLYESMDSIRGIDVPDALVYPRTEPVRKGDLRRSINQLQIICAGARQGSTSEKHQGDEAEGHVRRSGRTISVATPQGTRVGSEWWRRMSVHSELMSHVDAEVCRPPTATGEGTGVGSGRTEEEEVGYVVVSREGEDGEGLVCYRHDELIGEEAIRYSRGLHEEKGTGPMEEGSINPAAWLTREGIRARVEYQSRMADALQTILGPPGPLVPQSSVFLDYIPWVRYMVAVDDTLERRGGEGRARRGRCTRNSMGWRYVRSIELSEEDRALVRGSGYGDE